MQSRAHIIDGISGPGFFRLSLAVAVVVSHSTRLQLGKGAVLVFFILSGYWISVMWTGRYSKAANPYLTYLVSRTWRLIPTFWFISAMTIAGLALLGQFPPHVEWLHEFLSNILILGYNGLAFRPIDAAWSLDIEMQFYLLAPLVIMLSYAAKGRFWWLVFAACLMISFLNWKVSQDTIIQCIGFFAIGIAAATTNWSPSAKVAWGSVAVVAAAIILCVASPWRGVLLGGQHPTSLYIDYNMDAEIILAVLMAPWAIYTTKQRGFRHDNMFGDLSYIVYLLHLQILLLLGTTTGPILRRGAMTLLAYVVIAGVSLLVWRLFDHPINQMRSRWVKTRMAKVGRTGSVTARLSA